MVSLQKEIPSLAIRGRKLVVLTIAPYQALVTVLAFQGSPKMEPIIVQLFLPVLDVVPCGGAKQMYRLPFLQTELVGLFPQARIMMQAYVFDAFCNTLDSISCCV